MPEVQNPGLGGGQQAMLVATVNLTAAQIRALSGTPVQLVAAPGAGKVLVPFGFAWVFAQGTRPYQFTTGDSDKLRPRYTNISGDINADIAPLLTSGGSTFAYGGAFPGPDLILPGVDNSGIEVFSLFPYTNGSIATATLGAGGAGYAPNDTGVINTGSGDATYKVLTVDGGGAVLTFQITGGGTSYATGNGQATSVSGAQPGVGAGFTINITAVNAGDGTLKVTTYYQILPVP